MLNTILMRTPSLVTYAVKSYCAMLAEVQLCPFVRKYAPPLTVAPLAFTTPFSGMRNLTSVELAHNPPNCKYPLNVIVSPLTYSTDIGYKTSEPLANLIFLFAIRSFSVTAKLLMWLFYATDTIDYWYSFANILLQSHSLTTQNKSEGCSCLA